MITVSFPADIFANLSFTGRVLKTDHTFKVAKKVFMAGKRVYEAMVLVVNEYNQIIAHYFVYGKSHDELRPLLEALKMRYEKLGFPLPILW